MRSIFICLALSLVFASWSQAQATNDPYPIIYQHLYYARYPQAIAVANAALEQHKKEPQSNNYATALALAGWVQQNMDKFRPADSLLSAALALYEKNGAIADSNYLKTCSWLAGVCRLTGKLQRADSILQKANAAAGRCTGTPHAVHQATVLTQRFWLDIDRNKYQEALLKQAELMALLEKQWGKRHPRVAMALVSTTSSLETLTFLEQEASLLRAVGILEKHQKRYPKEYASALLELSGLYDEMSQYSKELQYLLNVKNFISTHLSGQHPLYALVLRELGAYYQYCSPNFRSARELYKEALGIDARHLGQQSLGYIAALRLLSNWYDDLGRIDTAEYLNNKAYESSQFVYGNNSPNTINMMLELAQNLEDKGDKIASDSLLNLADSLFLYLNQENTSLHVKILQKRAESKIWDGDYSLGIVDAETAYKIQLTIYGPENLVSIKEKLNLAETYLDAEKIQKSDSLFRIGLEALRRKTGVQSFLYAQRLETYTHVLVKCGKLDSAKMCAQQSMIIKQQLFGKSTGFIISSYERLINIQLAQNDYVDVEIKLAQNEMMARQIYGDTSKSMISLLSNRLQLYRKTKTPIEQIALTQKIIRLKEALGMGESTLMEMGSLALELSLNGEHATARQLNEELLIKTEEMYGKNHVYYFFQLLVAFRIYDYINDYNRAKLILDEYENLSSKTSVSYILNGLLVLKSHYFNSIGNYHEALSITENRLRQPGYILNPDDYYIWSAGFQNIENFMKADSVLQIGIQLAEQMKESTTTLYGRLAALMTARGQYGQALKIYSSTLSNILLEDGYYSNPMGNWLNNIANCLQKMNRLQEAKDTLYRALTIFNKLENYRGQAETMHLLYQVHHEQDVLKKAESDILKALSIAEERFGSSHPNTLFYLLDLAEYYRAIERYGVADSLFNKIIAIREQKSFGNSEHANALLLYGNFLNKVTGEYDRALRMMEKGLAMMDKIFPAGHPRQAEFYKGIGELYFNTKNYPRALEQYQKAAALCKKFNGAEHTTYASMQKLIGEVSRKMKNLPAAEAAYRTALHIDSLKLGPAHFYNAISLEGLMRVYELQGKYAQAEALGERCLQIVAKSRGEKNLNYANVAVRMASLLYRSNNYSRANALLNQAKEIIHAQIKLQFSQIAPSRQANLFDQFGVLDCFPTMLEQHPNDSLAGICFDNALLINGAILDNTRSLRQTILATKDATLLQLFDDYLAAQANLTDAEKNRANQPDSLEMAKIKLHRLEEAMAKKSPEFKEYTQGFELSWRDVQKALKPDEAAVMYLRYNRYRIDNSDSVFYAAMVVRQGWNAPRFVALVSESKITELVSDLANRGAKDAENIYDVLQNRGVDEVPGNTIYQLIWEPFAPLLQGASKIYFSPTGLLHRFNFNALPVKKRDKYSSVRLSERHELIQLRSVKQVLRPVSPPVVNNQQALLVGRVDFGPKKLASDWRRLEDETPDCADALKKQKYKVTFLHDMDATAQVVYNNLKKAPSPYVLHIATHGFFAPDLIKNRNLPNQSSEIDQFFFESNRSSTMQAKKILPKAWEQSALMRSALVFADANNLDSVELQKGKNPYILTAQDIAGLNLKETELVILSACETGLGDVFNNEGVYGLQRTFLQAGARSLIMSLWKVKDDDATTFMTKFYKFWQQEKKTPRQALLEAQKEMRWFEEDGLKKEHPAHRWAGFILVE